MQKSTYVVLLISAVLTLSLAACGGILEDPPVGTLLCKTVQDALNQTNCTDSVGSGDVGQMMLDIDTTNGSVVKVTLFARAQSLAEAPELYYKLPQGSEGHATSGNPEQQAPQGSIVPDETAGPKELGYPLGFLVALIPIVGLSGFIFWYALRLTLEKTFQITVPKVTCKGTEIDAVVMGVIVRLPTTASDLYILKQLGWNGVLELLTSRIQQWVKELALETPYEKLPDVLAEKCQDALTNGLVLPTIGAVFLAVYPVSIDLPLTLQDQAAAKTVATLKGQALKAYMAASGATDLQKAAEVYFLQTSGESGVVRVTFTTPK